MGRFIFVTYSGYPYTPSSLFPENALANFAGILKSQGHDVLILDFNTIDSISELITPEIHFELERIFYEMNSPFAKPGDPSIILSLKRVDRMFAVRKKRMVDVLFSRISHQIEKFSPHAIGFKIYAGDGYFTSCELAHALKKSYPGIKLFAGGPHLDLFGERIFTYTDAFDAVVQGEGEESILGLMDYALGKCPLASIPNVIYRENGRIKRTYPKRVDDLNSLPLPHYEPDVYPALSGDQKIKFFTIDDSRGCPNACPFCVHTPKSGGVRRIKRPERLIQDIKHIIKSCNSRVFRLAGSNTPDQVFFGLSNEIIKEGLRIAWSGFASVRGINPDNLNLYRNAGLRALFFGIESLDDRILNQSFKAKHTVSEAVDVLRRCMESGIYAVSSLIYPAPSETEESTANTLKNLLRIYKPEAPVMGSVTVNFPGLFPHTSWIKNPESYGFSIEDIDSYLNQAMNYRIRQFLPTELWDPLPYSLDGKPQMQLAREAGLFRREIESRGILTMLLDEHFLMAELMEMNPSDFLSFILRSFFTGDVRSIRNLTQQINLKAKSIGEV